MFYLYLNDFYLLPLFLFKIKKKNTVNFSYPLVSKNSITDNVHLSNNLPFLDIRRSGPALKQLNTTDDLVDKH